MTQLSLTSAAPSVTLDAFDLAILDLLQQDNTTSQRDIAQAVHLSAPAVQRRIRRLRESGVIRNEVAVLDASQVQFSILDVHAETLAYARELIGELGLDAHVAEYLCADAAAYRIPAGAMPDVIVSETMNTALGKEPQVAILRNLHAQAPSAALLPAAVSVHLGLDRRAPDAPCTDWGPIFTLDAEAMRAWRHEQGDSLPAASIRLPDVLEQAPRLLTRIRVHGDIVLHDYACSLNLPLHLPGKPQLTGSETLAFSYQLGSTPGLACEVLR